MEIPPKRLVAALTLVFLLGVLLSVVNGYYFEKAGEPLPVILYLVSLLSLLLGGALVILFQWKLNSLQLRRLLKVLPTEERRVIGLLLEHRNSLEQNRLVALSGYNKVKVSRIVKQLELRGAVRKARLGNTNLIVLDV